MDKRGSFGEWFLVILVMLVIGAASVFISVRLSKSECGMVALNYGEKNFQYLPEYSGKTPIVVCEGLGKDIASLSEQSYHDYFYGDAATNCDTDRGLGFGVYESRFAAVSEFDNFLVEKSTGDCRSAGNSISISNEKSAYTHVLCC